MPTVTLSRPSQIARFCLVAVLAAGCAPIRALLPTAEPVDSAAQASTPATTSTDAIKTPRDAGAPTIVTPPAPRPVRKLIVIQAKVDSKRRIVSGTKSATPLGADFEALARELVPQGVLPRGAEVDGVYAVNDTSVARTTANRHLVALRVRSSTAVRVALLVGDNDKHLRPYSFDGRPIGSVLLRYPVAHLTITSGYTLSRKHPISKKRRPHLGVDFAAPFGTPVVAVADGEVVSAKWAGGFGRLVRIQHEGEYASAYAHLQRYASGIKAGARVTQGQVIGYVGNSGQATGPHLHFTLLRAGKPIDPLAPGLPVPPRLADDALVAMHGESAHIEQILAAADRETAVATRLASARR